jgi:hypothetical protein
MKIKEIIREKYENFESPSDIENIIQKYESVIKDYIDHGTYIYRGMRNSGTLVVLDASKLNRKAANTYNYSNLLTGYLSSWNGWPPRYKSIPMSTNRGQSSGYSMSNGLYIAIPLENQKIGICLKDRDFWENFPIYVDTLNSALRQIFVAMGGSIYTEKPKDMIDMVDQFLDKLREGGYLEKTDDIKDIFPDVSGSWVFQQMFKKIGKIPDTGYELLNTLLDPNYGCKLVNGYKEIPLDHDKEVWCSGKILLINSKLFNDMQERVWNIK